MSRRRWLGAGLVVLGLWIALVPYQRVIPGGDIREFGRAITPQVDCGPALLAAFRGDDATLLLPGDNTGPVVVVDPEGFCRSRGRFRLATGLLFAVAGFAGIAGMTGMTGMTGIPTARRGHRDARDREDP